MNSKVLITGNSGMLGKDLCKVFKQIGAVVVGIDINEFVGNEIDKHYQKDLCDKVSVLRIINEEKPDIIIYAAAIVNLSVCEEKRKKADCLHVTIPELIAKNKKREAKFIYISTDSVFDGLKGNYTEDDLPNPLNYYSFSKLNGENAVLQNNNCLVIRTNIFGFNNPLKQSLAEWAVTNFHSDKVIIGFDDVIFNAIYTLDLASIIQKITNNDLEGIINIGSMGACSKFGFLQKLSKKLGYNTELIEKGSSRAINFKIKRPLKTNLNTKKIESITRIPSLEESVNRFCQNFKKIPL